MFRRLSFITTILALLTFSSCETKFTLNGDYERIPVVFGLLDQNESAHYIKITRTFLGDGNNYDFAQVADSSYFNQVDAQIIELDNGIETRRWQLHDTLIPNKESGTFYGPEQKIYVFYANDLDETMEYRIEADLDEGTYNIDATTKLIENFSLSFLIYTQGFTFSFGSPSSSETGKYTSFVSSYTEGENAALYNPKINIKYRETYSDGSSSDIVIPWSKGNVEQDRPESPSIKTLNFSGEEFYTLLESSIAVDANVIKRELLGLDLIIAIAHTEFAKYMEISQPSSSITQSTPQYTNVNSNTSALGLFSSRQIVTVSDLQISSGSFEELCTGQYTSQLGFCSSLPEHSGKSFYCD